MTNQATSVFSANPADAPLLLHVLPQMKFPWEKLLPGLQAIGKSSIGIEFADLSHFGTGPVNLRPEHIHVNGEEGHISYADRIPGYHDLGAHRAAWGLAWTNGLIQIEQTLRTQQANIDWVFSAESAHMVDFFYMTSRNLHPALTALVHPGGADAHPWFGGAYFDQVGEGWMAGFGLAYTDFVAEDPRFHHFTKAMAPQIWSILGLRRTDDVAPPPPPKPKQPYVTYNKIGFSDGTEWYLEVKAPPS